MTLTEIKGFRKSRPKKTVLHSSPKAKINFRPAPPLNQSSPLNEAPSWFLALKKFFSPVGFSKGTERLRCTSLMFDVKIGPDSHQQCSKMTSLLVDVEKDRSWGLFGVKKAGCYTQGNKHFRLVEAKPVVGFVTRTSFRRRGFDPSAPRFRRAKVRSYSPKKRWQ